MHIVVVIHIKNDLNGKTVVSKEYNEYIEETGRAAKTAIANFIDKSKNTAMSGLSVIDYTPIVASVSIK